MRPCMQGVVAQVRCCRYSECRFGCLTPLQHLRSTGVQLRFLVLRPFLLLSQLSSKTLILSILILDPRSQIEVIKLEYRTSGNFRCLHSKAHRPATFRFTRRNLRNVQTYNDCSEQGMTQSHAAEISVQRVAWETNLTPFTLYIPEQSALLFLQRADFHGCSI